MTNLDRIWIRNDQKRLIKKRAAEQDKTIPDVLDDMLNSNGLLNYEKELNKKFKRLL